MSELKFVNASGAPVDVEALKQKHKATPKAASTGLKRVDCRADAKQTDGFAVLGYSPEHWAQREAEYKFLLNAFTKSPVTAKHPGSLDEFTVRWMGKNKPKRARSKPYEIESSADQCADLMRKAGWLHVRVQELIKG